MSRLAKLAPRALVAAASLAVVSLVAYVDMGRRSPGPVASVHATVEGLEGGEACSACHGGFRTSMSEACLECHPAISEQLAGEFGLHGLPAPQDAARIAPTDCGRCHGEHHGASFALVNARAFGLAGVPDPERFDHTRIGWTMEGRHTELACVECHENADTPLLAAGTHRFLGKEQSCGTCHDDPHAGRFALACTTCHVQTGFDVHVAAGHERHLPLVGAHASLDCRSCHAEGDTHSLEVLAGGRTRPPSRGCADCHESTHDVVFLEGSARLAGVPRARVCGECHAPDHTRFRDERVTVTEDQHATTGFPLVGPHALVATDGSPGPRCADCHAPDLPSFQERHPGRTANDCAACHADPHGGQFALGAFADSTLTGGGCVQCHGEAAFAPHRFDDTLHATAAFVRDGAHAALDCNVCHVVPEPGAPRRFVGTPLRCEACHDDAHEGAFAARAEVLDATAAGACAHCHGTTTFDAVEAFAHGAFTGFELAGAHAESDCESCHAPAPERDALGRRFGRVHSHFPHIGEPAAPFDCARCHADPHGGSFAAACATCHVESSFRALPHGFDHGVATGFPLEGAHAAASCSACHDPLPFPTAEGRTAGPAAGTRCSDCHADPHGGQFHRVDTTFPGGGTDCSRCHTPDPGFPPSSFDHGWDTVFPLDGSHADVACAACHRPERMLVDGRELELVRYRPLGRECVDCHGEQAGALRRRGKGRGR